jgi:hypothetical protein
MHTLTGNDAATLILSVRQHVLDVDQLRFVTCWTACRDPYGRMPECGPGTWRRFGHPRDMKTSERPDCGVCAAVDVHCRRTGAARAAAVLAADAAFTHVLAGRTAVVPWVLPCPPAGFCLRERQWSLPMVTDGASWSPARRVRSSG